MNFSSPYLKPEPLTSLLTAGPPPNEEYLVTVLTIPGKTISLICFPCYF